MREKERELARAWERKHGRAPTSRELLFIANAATLQSRKGKHAGAIDWDALAARWDATLGGELAGVAPAVSDMRGAGAQGREHHGGRASPSGVAGARLKLHPSAGQGTRQGVLPVRCVGQRAIVSSTTRERGS